MLFGTRRRMPLTLALATILGLSLGLTLVSSVRADGMLFHHTIPREVDAWNYACGGPFMMPPVPYGHYAKDYVADAHKAAACLTSPLHSLVGKCLACCPIHKGGIGCGPGCGFAKGCSLGHGDGCATAGTGIGCSGIHGLFGHEGGGVCTAGAGAGICGGGAGICGSGGGICGGRAGLSGGVGYATTGPTASGQVAPIASSQSGCGDPGCHIGGKHSHNSGLMSKGCGLCGGRGCGACAGLGGGGTGCGLCGGMGCGKCKGGTGCGLCGGMGCAKCLGALKGCLAGLHGKLASVCGIGHGPKMQWFLGAGGPVPLTPGYVPYIVTTRSPRDFFSFAPMNPNDR